MHKFSHISSFELILDEPTWEKIGRNRNLRCITINLSSKPLKTLSFCLKQYDDILLICWDLSVHNFAKTVY